MNLFYYWAHQFCGVLFVAAIYWLQIVTMCVPILSILGNLIMTTQIVIDKYES